MNSARRSGWSAAPAAAIAYQTAPCSPSLETVTTARSTAGACPRVRSNHRRAVSALDAAETGPLLLRVQPHVDDLREVEHHLGAVGVDRVPALGPIASKRVAQGLVGPLAQAQDDRLAAGEADIHVARALPEALH